MINILLKQLIRTRTGIKLQVSGYGFPNAIANMYIASYNKLRRAITHACTVNCERIISEKNSLVHHTSCYNLLEQL